MIELGKELKLNELKRTLQCLLSKKKFHQPLLNQLRAKYGNLFNRINSITYTSKQEDYTNENYTDNKKDIYITLTYEDGTYFSDDDLLNVLLHLVAYVYSETIGMTKETIYVVKALKEELEYDKSRPTKIDRKNFVQVYQPQLLDIAMYPERIIDWYLSIDEQKEFKTRWEASPRKDLKQICSLL